VIGDAHSCEPIDLNATDRKILALLRDEGRRPNAEIARTVGVSEATVRRRLDRMLQSGVLRVIPVLNAAATGYPVDAIIGIRVKTGFMRAVGRQLAAIEQVVYVGYVTGSHDIIIEVLLRSNEALFEFLSLGLEHVDGIVASETFTVLNTEKFSYMWLPTDNDRSDATAPPVTAQQPASQARPVEES
jgi:Lrp/AsnC family transcriptional regulator, regulator for asnA, asnC and gidA